MTEQHIAMQTIRYLAQVCEAFSKLLQTGSAENETSAIHCIRTLSQDIQQIAQNSCEEIPQQKHLWYMRDAMLKLVIIVRQQGEILSRSGQPIPSEKEVEVLRLAIVTSKVM